MDEYTIDGTLCNIDFGAEEYFEEYESHLRAINELASNEYYGPLFQLTIKSWAVQGRYKTPLVMNYLLLDTLL